MWKAVRETPLNTRIVRGVLLSFVLVGLMAVIPTPYYLEAPGRALDLDDLIKVPNSPKKSRGRVLLPTVISEPATILYCAVGLLDPNATLTRRSADGMQAQTGTSERESMQGEDRQMQLSQYFGTRAALKELGYAIEDRLLGFRVVAVDKNSPNFRVIEPGDLLVQVAGSRLESLSALATLLEEHSQDPSLPLLVTRSGSERHLEAQVWETRAGPRLGIILTPQFERATLPVEIEFPASNTVGASGGLAFGVAIYNRLWEQGELVGSRVVAASGTLEPDGSIGAVEGLPFKVVAAERAGASILLYPQVNAADLSQVSSSLRLIPVSSFEEALDALKN